MQKACATDVTTSMADRIWPRNVSMLPGPSMREECVRNATANGTTPRTEKLLTITKTHRNWRLLSSRQKNQLEAEKLVKPRNHNEICDLMKKRKNSIS
jgi:hypothetical protein